MSKITRTSFRVHHDRRSLKGRCVFRTSTTHVPFVPKNFSTPTPYFRKINSRIFPPPYRRPGSTVPPPPRFDVVFEREIINFRTLTGRYCTRPNAIFQKTPAVRACTPVRMEPVVITATLPELMRNKKRYSPLRQTRNSCVNPGVAVYTASLYRDIEVPVGPLSYAATQ